MLYGLPPGRTSTAPADGTFAVTIDIRSQAFRGLGQHPAVYPQCRFASFSVVNPDNLPGQRLLCAWFESRHLHQRGPR